MENIFLEAVVQSNVKTVLACLEKGVDPNVVTDDRAALHIASIKGDLCVGVLLMTDSRTDLNLRTFIGLTPLIFACIYERRKFVQALLAAGALVNIVSDKGITALHYACMKRNIGMVSDLVSHGANVNAIDVFDNSPLSTAVIDYPSVAVARFLLRKGASATEIKHFPLFLGRKIMEKIFFEAVLQSNVETVSACLEKGVDPNVYTDDRSALHITSVYGDLHVGALLMNNPRTDLNVRNYLGLTPLSLACIYKKRRFGQAILCAGAKVNIISDTGKTALHYACMKRDIGMVFDLVSYGARLNAIDVLDNTPLSISVIDFPSVAITRFLLRKGASATIKQFPLFLECALTCSSENRLKILQILVSYDIDVNCTHPVSGMNCLHYIAITDYIPAGEFLLKSGASLQHLDKANRTPIDVAVQHQNRDVVRLYRDWTRHRRIYFAEAEEVLEDIRLLFNAK